MTVGDFVIWLQSARRGETITLAFDDSPSNVNLYFLEASMVSGVAFFTYSIGNNTYLVVKDM